MVHSKLQESLVLNIAIIGPVPYMQSSPPFKNQILRKCHSSGCAVLCKISKLFIFVMSPYSLSFLNIYFKAVGAFAFIHDNFLCFDVSTWFRADEAKDYATAVNLTHSLSSAFFPKFR